jgi:hypothetical protein
MTAPLLQVDGLVKHFSMHKPFLSRLTDRSPAQVVRAVLRDRARPDSQPCRGIRVRQIHGSKADHGVAGGHGRQPAL